MNARFRPVLAPNGEGTITLGWDTSHSTGDMDGEATVQITYFTSGITWSADYIGIASRDETNLALEGFVRVTNHSGEEYEDAEIRLVVGKSSCDRSRRMRMPRDRDEAKSVAPTACSRSWRRWFRPRQSSPRPHLRRPRLIPPTTSARTRPA